MALAVLRAFLWVWSNDTYNPCAPSDHWWGHPATSLDLAHPFFSQEVVELDGRVSKVTESIETLQETIHGVKMELEQLRRDHCAIMQYLLHLPVSYITISYTNMTLLL